MILTRLRGGLGNQMFQYAFGKSLSLHNDAFLKVDLSWFSSSGSKVPFREYSLGIFNLEVSKATSFDLLKSKILYTHIKENNTKINFGNQKNNKNIYLDGFWQNPKYFEKFEEIIKKDFSFKRKVLSVSNTELEEINLTDSVCINVRRTDFVSDDKFVGLLYYKQSIEFILSKIPRARFFIFSDEIQWCKDNFNFLKDAVYLDHTHAGDKFSNYLHLMSLCNHFIIPNSTFAWWAAWLSTTPTKIIVAPKIWSQGNSEETEDIVPKDWIRI